MSTRRADLFDELSTTPSTSFNVSRDEGRLNTWSVWPKFSSMRALKHEARGVVASSEVLEFAEQLRAVDIMDVLRHSAYPLFRRNSTRYLGIYWKLVDPELEEGDPGFFLDETNRDLINSFDYDSWYPLEGAKELLSRCHELARIILVNAMRYGGYTRRPFHTVIDVGMGSAQEGGPVAGAAEDGGQSDCGSLESEDISYDTDE
ncbi:hypothetical protein CDV31_000624 [Fusarium ambrosium]|uniref:Uncharacterized protein n=1 Tax=Fusarium ambrosium TaxID=131363 RepID=A0A428V1J6_9HYPO|nr:hypothetical protein CDV31_000624 [Fusarium ambrosium]